MTEQNHATDLNAVQQRLLRTTQELESEHYCTDLTQWSFKELKEAKNRLRDHKADLDKLQWARREAGMLNPGDNSIIDSEKLKVALMKGTLTTLQLTAMRTSDSDDDDDNNNDSDDGEEEPERGRSRHRRVEVDLDG
ncbi:uncharacterized protein STEHIDRAFT_158384 [Stereum hirsutum FP-91666 SS1]|uniref:uncharacterized protein n=1 Tax=Stereum hirsutum (strain FP-91666) TaxID=721885 RepID=UPI0004449ABD|nr:uncharacterized protein STEHIDRAFT_158384 [Stereum hirsutum FP-91666 SS1]EIM84668.1 hypothetical protein STEHIDRAFT_158384 [Stereum hirsutum FP-91666 SS1]